jgi:hypothetical protein
MQRAHRSPYLYFRGKCDGDASDARRVRHNFSQAAEYVAVQLLHLMIYIQRSTRYHLVQIVTPGPLRARFSLRVQRLIKTYRDATQNSI